MSYFEHRKDYIDKVKQILYQGDIIPFQESTCYDEDLCATCASAIEHDLGRFEEIDVEDILAIVFGYFQYLSDHNQIAPVDSEYLSQLILVMVLYASHLGAESASKMMTELLKRHNEEETENDDD